MFAMVAAIVKDTCKNVQRKPCVHYIETSMSLNDYNVRLCHGVHQARAGGGSLP